MNALLVTSSSSPSRRYLSYLWRRAENCLLNSWWVLLCTLTTYAGYEQAQQRYLRKAAHYRTTLNQLEAKKAALLHIQRGLQEQIHSQDDPAWIELTLIKRLGLIPKNERKIVFHYSEEDL